MYTFYEKIFLVLLSTSYGHLTDATLSAWCSKLLAYMWPPYLATDTPHTQTHTLLGSCIIYMYIENLRNLCETQPSHFWWTQQQNGNNNHTAWFGARNQEIRSGGAGGKGECVSHSFSVCFWASKKNEKKKYIYIETKTLELKTFLGPIYPTPLTPPDDRSLAWLLSMPDHTNPYSNIHVVWLALFARSSKPPKPPRPTRPCPSSLGGKLETMQNDANGWILISSLSRWLGRGFWGEI